MYRLWKRAENLSLKEMKLREFAHYLEQLLYLYLESQVEGEVRHWNHQTSLPQDQLLVYWKNGYFTEHRLNHKTYL